MAMMCFNNTTRGQQRAEHKPISPEYVQIHQITEQNVK